MEHKFSKNSRYYTIGIYAIVFILIATICIKLVWNWDETSSLLGALLDVVQPFLLGLLIAYFINPLAKLISRKLLKNIFKIKSHGVRKVLSVLIAYIIVISAIVTAMFYIVPQIVESLSQLSNFIDTAQTGYGKIMNKLQELNEKYPQWKLDGVIDMIKGVPSLITDFIKNTVPTLLPTLYSTSMSVISGLINMLISIIVSVYMLIDKSKLINNSKRVLYSFVKTDKADRLLDTLKECNKIFGNFLIGKMIDSLIIGILCFIILTVVEIPYAVMISVIVGVTNMIPYFGPFIGAIPGILLLLIVDFKYALLFGIIIFALQQFDGLYLGPKILGESTGLRPLWIIFAITVGGWAAGVAGMFLGVPFTAVIAYLMDRGIEKRLQKKGIVFETNPDNGIMKRDRNVPIIQEDKIEAYSADTKNTDEKSSSNSEALTTEISEAAKNNLEANNKADTQYKNNSSYNKNSRNKNRNTKNKK